MNEGEAVAYIQAKIKVTPQMVTIAKVGIFRLCEGKSETDLLIKVFLAEMDAEMPLNRVMLDITPEPLETLDRIANSLNWHMASAEAIWDLVNNGLLIPQASERTFDMTAPDLSISWSKGPYQTGWIFEEYRIQMPRFVIKRRSRTAPISEDLFLSNHDLYIHNIDIQNMSSEIIKALQEAIKCFRYELFLASVTMLGKASEGAWMELGASLLGAANSQAKDILRIKEILENTRYGVNQKIEAVIKLCEHGDLFTIIDRSGVRIHDLRDAALWSDAVRDSRNTIHFGNSPSVPNTYEKVAALILGAVPAFRKIYKLKLAADTNVS